MEDCTRKPDDEKEIPEFGPDSIEVTMRARVRETIEAIVEEELEAALGARKSARVGEARQGYRHGSRARTLTTSLGPTTMEIPRARIRQVDGISAEWRSDTVGRYQRRTQRVDEAILGIYLAGTNTRWIKGALRSGAPRRYMCLTTHSLAKVSMILRSGRTSAAILGSPGA